MNGTDRIAVEILDAGGKTLGARVEAPAKNNRLPELTTEELQRGERNPEPMLGWALAVWTFKHRLRADVMGLVDRATTVMIMLPPWHPDLDQDAAPDCGQDLVIFLSPEHKEAWIHAAGGQTASRN